MIHRKTVLSCAAVLMAFAILLPSIHSADAVEDVKAKIAPELNAQLTAAQPMEHVTAIVKMSTVANLKSLRGDKAAVFTELRAVAARSQDGLLRYLDGAAVKPKVKLTRQFWIDNLVLVQATPDVIREIAARPDVQRVFDNYTLSLPPRDRSVSQQTPFWDSMRKIGAKQVWSTYGLDGTGVVLGGLDTGVDITHPDLAGKMKTNNPSDPTYPGGWAEFNSTGGRVVGSVPHDSDEHGTHTMGTAAGGSASGYAIGVAPGATIMHGLVIPGGSGSFAQVAAGMQWIIDPDNNAATDDGSDVVNMSLGATGTYSDMIAPTDNMVAANVFPSFSIGNSGPNPNTTGSPGNVPSAFGVGATDSLDVIASFSSRGPVTWNSPPYVGTWIKPDISAPGVLIFSSVPGGSWEAVGWSGTSMAAPHVTGTVALMLQANPSLTVETTKQLLAQTAVDRGNPGMDNTYGWGRVNAFGAVTAALTGIGTLEGTVYSSAGGTVEGAKITLTDTGQRVYSKASGYYMLKAIAGDHTVEVTRFGYQPYTTTVTLTADETTTLNVTLQQLPSGVIAGAVTDAETGSGIGANITINYLGEPVLYTSTNPATGGYSVTLPVGTYDLVFNPVFPYPVTTRTGIAVVEGVTTTLNLALQRAQILIVDDDVGKDYQTYFEQAVAGAGRSYLTITTPPTAATMALFESVVWLTGNDYTTTLTTADQGEIAAFLDGGGRLFLTGQDIGFDIYTSPFYADYLHATYVQDDVNLGGVIGVPTNPVGHGFTFDIKGGSGANNQAYPSEINPIPPALAAFVYDPEVPTAATTANEVVKNAVPANGITSSGTGALTFDNGVYKLVYFAFGFEAVADATTRTMLMDRILDWLQGYPKITHTPLVDTENTENPYRVVAYIASEYFPLDPSTFFVVYNKGMGDVSVPMAPTGVPDEYAAFIPAQGIGTEVAYYITATDTEGHTTTDPMGAPGTRHTFRVAWDTEDPMVFHMWHRNTNDLEGPYHVYAEAMDNIGIECMYLLWAKNGGTFHRQLMELLPDGRYHGAIPGPCQVGDYFDYRLYAMDEAYAGNALRMPLTGAYHFEIVEHFAWDFELYDGDFAVIGDVWEWGEPTTGPGEAHSGVKLWATKLADNYPNNADARLEIPAITLAASKPYAILTFWHWYSLETLYDGGNVKVSADAGDTWDILTPMGGYDGIAKTTTKGIPGEPCFTGYNDQFWQQELFDLSAYSGESIVIRFHMGSDGSVYKPGWYIDDVMLRSTAVDDIPPVISGTTVPASTFDTAGPYTITTRVMDPLSAVAGVSIFYTTNNGATFTEIPMTPGGDDLYTGAIPGQPAGTRIKFYVKATDTSAQANAAFDPAGAPADLYAFGIMPSAPILVVVSGLSTGTSLDMFREALSAEGHEADYWNRTTQGWLATDKLLLYKYIFVDEPSGLTTTQMSSLADFLNAGSLGVKKRLVLMGRDLGFSSATRPWLEQYLRANYVQDNPSYYEITGYPGDPIGAGETFVISGSYPDEWQRSTIHPGGEIVYQYTGPGTSRSRAELQGEYEKEGKEWDGIVPHAPKSLDAAAAIKYNDPKYRSVAFAFNLYYILQPDRRAAVMDRTLSWLSAPDIVHTPLRDTENTTDPYAVVALMYSETLDPTRIYLTYDVGAGPVPVRMTATGVPNEYRAYIPAQPNGTTVQYYLSAANLDGTTSYHPSGAPAEQHIFRVTTDITPPEIVHMPLGNQADLVGPYVITATITDNVGIDPAGVTVTYNKNGGANVTIPMANVGGDGYEAAIPGPAALGDVFNYFIRARDIAAVPNTARHPAVGYHSFTIVDYYAWDFEASDGGYAGTGDWEWGAPTTGPGGAYSGAKLWATKLAATYSASSNSRLETPAVKVPASAPYATLSFWQWYAMESNYDGGNVKISTNGGATWTLLTPDIGYNGTSKTTTAGIPSEPIFTGTTTGNFWHKATFNLTPYKGQTVMIRFHFGSDASVQYAGWYVDDVMIAGANDTAPPAFISTTVPGSTWDTVGPYVVKTKVKDPLAGIASVTLYYSTNDGATWTPVAMAPTGVADEYSGGIPGQPARTRIKLYLSAADNAANTSFDPAGAPANTYQFSIMPWGDYLVILGGGSYTPAQTFFDAFSAIGRTCDVWNWDTQGLPSLAMLNAYVGVIVDESWYFDAAQVTLLTSFLTQDDGVKQQIMFWGRDLSYGTGTHKAFMERFTGMAYVQDDPGTAYRWLWSTMGDPIGNNERIQIAGYYPDELKRSTTYPGAQIIFKYHLSSTTSFVIGSEEELLAYYYKEGKEYDGVWPMAPTAPDSAAAGRYVGGYHASVYFAFQFNYIQNAAAREGVLDRALNWLATASSVIGKTDIQGGETPEVPAALALYQNYPNPFNPITTIQFGVPEGVKGRADLRIYNVKGELVRTLFEGTVGPGIHTYRWDGTNDYGRQVTSGIYFCRFSCGGERLTRKMVLLR